MSNKIQLTTLTMRNFLSYGNNTTIVKFNESGTTMILGEDLDNTANGQGANGVGKTVLVNAVAYALYDKPVSNISKDNLVNNLNKKHMLVTVDFTNGKDEFRIERARKMKSGASGNWVKFLKKIGEGDYEDLSRSSKNTNGLIERVIGIPYDLFCQIVVFSATKTPFLDLPVRHPQQTNQTSMIEELFGLTELSEKADIIKKNSKLIAGELEKHEIRMGQIEREHARHSDQVDAAKARVIKWERDNVKNVAGLKKELQSIEGIDFETERSLHDSLLEMRSKLVKITTELSTNERELKGFIKKKKVAATELAHIEDEKCPYCLQEFTDTQLKLNDLEQTISDNEHFIGVSSVVLGDLYSESEDVQGKIDNINKQITVSDIEELIKTKAQSTQIEDKISTMEKGDNPFVEPLEELENVELDPVDYTEINKLKKTVSHEKFLVKILTKRDSFVRKVLLNKNLPFLNRRLTKYLIELGLQHRVEFNGELVAEISRFGRPLDFGNLSNGQRARVNIALSFAFRDVLQQLHTPINICLLDEVLDVGLDSVGVQAAAKMIKHMARNDGVSVYVISHREELESAFDKTMVVQMLKGFSYIKEIEL